MGIKIIYYKILLNRLYLIRILVQFKKLKEITKLVTTDLVMTIASILVIDFFRALWVRYTNIWWFWNLETTFVCFFYCYQYLERKKS